MPASEIAAAPVQPTFWLDSQALTTTIPYHANLANLCEFGAAGLLLWVHPPPPLSVHRKEHHWFTSFHTGSLFRRPLPHFTAVLRAWRAGLFSSEKPGACVRSTFLKPLVQ